MPNLPQSIHFNGVINNGELDGQRLIAQLNQLWNTVRKFSTNIGADNLNVDLAGDGLDIVNRPPSGAGGGSGGAPGGGGIGGGSSVPRLVNTLADTQAGAYLSPKQYGGVTYGMELSVDASSAYGRFCIKDKDYSTQQLASVVPDDPASVSNPGASFQTNYGIMYLKTTAAFNLLLQRNSTTKLTIGSSTNSNANQVTWDSSLGAITHLLGPADQTFKILPGSSQTLTIGDQTGSTKMSISGSDGVVSILGTWTASGGVLKLKLGAGTPSLAVGEIGLDTTSGNLYIGLD